MRQDLRKLKYYSQIICMATLSLGLQACSTGPKLAMDYLPDTAKILIEKDIENGHQVDEQKESAISVKSMLASILGLGDYDEEIKVPSLAREPITKLYISSLKPEDFVEPTETVYTVPLTPLPQKKPVRLVVIEPKILEVIDLQLDEEIIAAVQIKTESLNSGNASAEISIGPIGEAENAQIASLQAMIKANAIGNELRTKFKTVKIKFNPLQPFGTVKITIKGKKQNA